MKLQDEFLVAIKLNEGDYDRRTALHLAAAEDHIEVVQFLLDTGYFETIQLKDRFGNTPFDDAMLCGNMQVAKLIKDHYDIKSIARVAETPMMVTPVSSSITTSKLSSSRT